WIAGRGFFVAVRCRQRNWHCPGEASVGEGRRVYRFTKRRYLLNEDCCITPAANSVLCRDEQHESSIHFARRNSRKRRKNSDWAVRIVHSWRRAILYQAWHDFPARGQRRDEVYFQVAGKCKQLVSIPFVDFRNSVGL